MHAESVDAGAGKAEELYALRPRLVRFFAAKGRSSIAEDLADDTILRVFKKLKDGAPIENLGGYTLGVARHVWFEFLRRPPVDPLPDDFADQQPEVPETDDLDCLERSLQEIPAGARALILRFYGAGADDTKNKELRRALAAELGISMNALFLRASKLRGQLARRIEACREAPGPGGQESSLGRTNQEERV